MMKKILISSCLLGQPVRYNGGSEVLDNDIVRSWRSLGVLVAICPEVAGGLPTPRQPAEIVLEPSTMEGTGDAVLIGQGKIKTAVKQDVTKEFLSGAQKTLEMAQSHQVVMAIMTERSPSCGSSKVYDGSFSRQLVAGMGVTVALLRSNGIKVFSQNQLEAAQHYYEALT